MRNHNTAWQENTSLRAFRLLGYSLPTLIIASLAASILPAGQPKLVLERSWGESVLIRGRLELPKRGDAEIPTAWVIEGPMPKPENGVLSIRVKTLNNDVDTKKRWNFAPTNTGEGSWSSTFNLKLPGGELMAYRIRSEGRVNIPSKATLKVYTDPARPIDRYLHMIAFLRYPSSIMVLIAGVMLFFARSSRKV